MIFLRKSDNDRLILFNTWGMCCFANVITAFLILANGFRGSRNFRLDTFLSYVNADGRAQGGYDQK